MLQKAVLGLGLVLTVCSMSFPLVAQAQQTEKVVRLGIPLAAGLEAIIANNAVRGLARTLRVVQATYRVQP